MAHPQHGPLDTLWRPTTLIWILVAGVALSLVLALAPGLDGDRLVYFGLTSLLVQWIVLLVVGALYLLRRPLARVPPQWIARLALALLMLSTWLVGGLAWSVLRSMGLVLAGWWEFFMQISAIALVMGLAGLAVFQNHWRSRQLALRAKQSELDALRARIHPHFLFNTLNTATALVRVRPDEAERVLLDLADLFRAALRGPELIPLSEEIELTRRYLEIEALRFGPRLRVAWSLPDPLPEATVPALSLQPLAENAIRHGIERIPRGGGVEIRMEHEAGWIRIEVWNDLPGDGSRAPEGHRIGLNSARQRVRALSGGRGDVETRVVEGRHVAVLRIPDEPATR